MFDIAKTLNLVKGGLLEHRKTWKAYFDENRDWKETAILLTGPLILVSFLLSLIFGWVFSSQYMFSVSTGFWVTIFGLVATVISIIIAAFIFSYLAGVFKGKHDFNRGFAAISLSAIPGYLGTVLGTLPWIGWLLAGVLAITSLVFLYKIIPLYLEVPTNKRVLHFIVSLALTIVFVFTINMIIGVGTFTTIAMNPAHTQGSNAKNTGSEYAIFGDLERQANMAELADKDHYEAPNNGKITDDQMASLIITMQKTKDYRKRQSEQMKKLDEEMKDKQDFNLSDFGKMATGISSAMTMVNAEMEVVKSGGGNWAEHQWVKDQLRIAAIQKDLNDTVKHNFSLYQKYSDQLKTYELVY